MESRRPRGPWAWVLAGAGVLAVLALLAAVFNLGPFREPELTSSKLIAQGDEICRKAHVAFADLQRHLPRTAAEAAELTGRLIDIAGDEADELESLNGPPEFDAQVEDYVAAREDGIEAMRAGRAAAEDRDTQGYKQEQAEVADSQRDRHRIARDIGFAICSRPLKLSG
jgi:signal transduction histidine kinase